MGRPSRFSPEVREDRTVTGRGYSRPLLGHGHPVSWLPYELPAGDDRQVSSQDRRSVKLRVRPPPAGTHQCHRATSAGSGMMLTVKLTRIGRDDPTMTRFPSPFSRHTSPRPTRGTSAFSAYDGAQLGRGGGRHERDSARVRVPRETVARARRI